MAALNLPAYTPTLRKSGERIDVFDPLRQKFVSLTPEEQVRQAFVNYLTAHKGYPVNLMANEVSLSLNGMQRRCDTVLYDLHLHPRMIIEYKRPTVKLSQRVFDQISRYNIVMHVDYLVVSNGIEHYCCRMDYAHLCYRFLTEIPDYADLTSGSGEAQ